jgi:predicted DNA-binding protein (MmcQ/YjbR family)
MNAHQVRDFCLTFPGCTAEVQWEDKLLFKVGEKIFVISGMKKLSNYSLKCNEEEFNELVEFEGITQAPYLARKKWIQVDPELCNLKRKEVENLITVSYNLIFNKLTKKIKATIKK